VVVVLVVGVVVVGAVVVGAVLVVVVGGAVVVVGGAVVVVVPPQPPSHASQQLDVAPTHAWPSFGGLHLSALDLIEHFSLPRLSMRQHVTKPGLPHVDLAAHLVTAPLQLWLTSVPLACSVAHLTYWPWFVAPAQSQFAAIAACAAATSAASAPVASHLASLRCAQSKTIDRDSRCQTWRSPHGSPSLGLFRDA